MTNLGEPLEQTLTQAADGFDADVGRLQCYIRQPSITALNQGLDEMAGLLVADIEALGGIASVWPGPAFPIVYGKIDAGAERTVLIHSMYDVVPADEPEWIVEPFAATRMEFADKGDCIIARGAEDTKGPVSVIFSALNAMRAADVPFPVNFLLIFEASELGSADLPAFVDAYQDELRQADVAYWPFFTQRADGTPVVWLGIKGLTTFKLRCTGGDWGGPARGDLHSGNATWFGNPAERLIAAIACLRKPDGTIAVTDFYEGRGEPSEDEERMIKILAQRLDGRRILEEFGVARFRQDSMEDAIRAQCFDSPMNIAGLKSGFVVDDAHKAIIPGEAVASMDLRCVGGMTPEGVERALRRHLDAHGFEDVTLEILNSYGGGGTPAGNWAVRSLLGTYETCGLDPEVWPRGSISIASGLFTNFLGMPWIATLPGHAGGKHGPNEYLQIDGYRRAIEFLIRLLYRIAAAERD
ncbi:MAG: M20/M25/M40 family metallo-hydrolase [Alphaproteobacteria bacterium]|nr:M20/M25/M40 family metallo-hydrolase [Alphaproteobacteria bacterium]